MDVATIWNDIVGINCSDKELLDILWKEIETNYSSKERYYHTIEHICRMLDSSERFKTKLTKIEVVKLAIIYHDIIYKPQRDDNEEKSALLAKQHLLKLNFPSNIITACEKYIVATKKHKSDDNDINLNYLLDFDLEILGTSWEVYKKYTEQIRQEYKMYPDFLYKKGRIKVLKHFLNYKSIYKTDDYICMYELRARENIEKELMSYL